MKFLTLYIFLLLLVFIIFVTYTQGKKTNHRFRHKGRRCKAKKCKKSAPRTADSSEVPNGTPVVRFRRSPITAELDSTLLETRPVVSEDDLEDAVFGVLDEVGDEMQADPTFWPFTSGSWYPYSYGGGRMVLPGYRRRRPLVKRRGWWPAG